MSDIIQLIDPELEKMVKDTYNRMMRVHRRREKKKKTVLSQPFYLKDGLNQLTKEELEKTRKKYKIDGSGLKKDQLVQLLAEMIPVYFQGYLEKLDQERFDLIKSANRNQGIIPLEIIPFEAVHYFELSGVFFLGTLDHQKVLIMPHELRELFNQFDISSLTAKVKNNTLWKDALCGMTSYYGIIQFEKAVELLQTLTGETIKGNEDHFLEVVQDLNMLLPEMKFVDIHEVLYVADIRLAEPELMLNEHLQRPDIPFYPVTLDQLLNAEIEDDFSGNKYTDEFISFMQWNFVINDEDAEELVEDIQRIFLTGGTVADVYQILDELIAAEHDDLYKDLMALVTDIFNNTRSWILKGYTPNQLADVIETKNPGVKMIARHKSGNKKKEIIRGKKNNVLSFENARKNTKKE